MFNFDLYNEVIMIERKYYLFILLSSDLLLGSCRQGKDNKAIKVAVKKVLFQSVTNWNSGNIGAYVRDDSLQFDGNDSTTYGWEQGMLRYEKTYPDKPATGYLRFSYFKIKVLSPTAAFISGHWELTKKASHPEIPFTLLFRKTTHGRRIVYDLSSSKIK